MSFNPSSKQQKSPLVENDSKEILEGLQKKYLNFIKIYEKMLDYEKKLNSFSRREYDQIKDEIHEKIHQLPKLLNDIFLSINNIESLDNNDTRTKEQTKIINEKLKPKQSEIQSLIKKICDKEASVAKKLSVFNPDDIEKATRNFQTLNSFDSNANLYSDEEKKRPSVLGFRESKIIVQDVMDQNTYLDLRTKELEDIKKVATQIKDLSSNMRVELEEQGKKVEQIDKNVDEVKSNVIKAELEIQEADKISKSDNKRFRCLVFLILALLLGILLAVLFIYVV